MTGTIVQKYINALYVVMYDRAADSNGYNYWLSTVGGASASQTAVTDTIAQTMAGSFRTASPTYFNTQYSALSDTNFILQLYANLGNTSSGVGGDALNYWQGRLDSFGGDRAKLAGDFTKAFLEYNGTDAAGLVRKAAFENKVAVSQAWVDASRTNAFMNASATTDASFAAQMRIIDGVDHTAASLQLVLAQVNSVVSTGNLANAVGIDTGAFTGQTFMLTANADGPGAIAPSANTTGTSGNDTYNAADTTLQSADIINGAGGTDTLAVRAAAGAATTVTPLLTSVEVVEITQVGAGAYTLNAISATGMTTASVKDQASTAALVEFENLASAVAGRLDNADGQVQFSYSGAATRTGTSDAVALQIANGSGSSTTAAVLDLTDGAAAADATFENVNITASGAASRVNFDLGNTSLRVINVSGDAAVGTTAIAGGVQNYALSLDFTTTAAAALRTVSASGMTGTGGLNIDTTDSTQTTVAFTGSAQNDRVVIDGALANAVNTFSLNAGSGGANDIVAVDAITDFAAAGQVILRQTVNAATGFEAFEATAAAVTTLDADQFTSINSFIFSGAQTAGHAITNLRTGDSLTYTVDSTRAGDVMTLSGAVAGQSASMTLTGGVDITATNAGDNGLTLNAGLTSFAIVSSNVQGLATAGAVNRISALTTDAAIDNVSATNFTASGAAGLTIGAVAGLAAPVGFSQAVNFDASALTGVLRIAGSANADVIKGGSGADIIYSIGGNDELTGNGGADQFRLLDAAGGVDVIKDFTVGTDDIGVLTGFVDFAGTAGVAAGVALAATDYEAARNDITGIVVGDTLKVIELQTALTTAQIGAQLGAAANAFVVVFNSTTGKGEMWYDADWSNIGARSQLATFDNITSLVGVQSFTNGDFVEVLV